VIVWATRTRSILVD